MTAWTARGERGRSGTWAAAVAIAGVLFWACPQLAWAQVVTFTQITNTTGGGFSNLPSLSGTRVAFESERNIVNPAGCPALPGNPDGNLEIYIFDSTTGCFSQVTNTTGGGFLSNINPSLSGTRVAFRSTSNLVNPGGCPALPGNADGNQEIYLFDLTTSCYTQVTNTTGGVSGNIKVSLSGTRVAFDSDRNLVNPGGCPVLPGNADGNSEIYLFDTTTGCYIQVTNTTGGFGNTGPSVNATRVAFDSDRNLVNPGGCPVLPGNADGNFEIYLFDVTTGCYTQVTNTTGNPAGADLSLNGTRLAFRSVSNLVNPGGCPALLGNADGNTEIYLFDVTTGCFTQVTNTTGGGIFGSNVGPSLSGTRVAFRSDRNLVNPGGCPVLPGNADTNIEVYVFDVTTGCLTQITNTTGGGDVRPSLDGTVLALDSNRDTTQLTPCPGCPGNADANFEIFLASLVSPSAAIPTLSEWAQLGMVAVLVLGAFLALRRRASDPVHGRPS